MDEVKLDVIPLDICGMVLGSPYLYDRKAIFSCHENKCQITKHGIEYTVSAHQTKINSSLVSSRQMKRLVNSNKGCMLMVVRGGGEMQNYQMLSMVAIMCIKRNYLNYFLTMMSCFRNQGDYLFRGKSNMRSICSMTLLYQILSCTRCRPWRWRRSKSRCRNY